jgi:pimeloyl-ACP methyl ester carboxylesterase
MVADVVGLINAARRPKATIVGHDWGGAVAWYLAAEYPQRIEKLVILNLPHPEVARHHFSHSLRQMGRSSYGLFFQLPWLPEAISRWGRWRAAEKAMVGSSRPGTFSQSDLAVYRRAWEQPRAFSSMVNWYRAALRHRPARLARPLIEVPTLLIWGAQDAFLGREMAEPSIEMCRDGQLVMFEEATHWLHHEEPELVNDFILDFQGRPAG